MREGRICVAGLTNRGEHIRPCPDSGQLMQANLLSRHGVFDIGALVDLGPVRDIGAAPELEDRQFSLRSARYDRHLEPDVYWNFLNKQVKPNLRAAFGPNLKRFGTTMTVQVGCGTASLGVVRAPASFELFLDERNRVRARVAYEDRQLLLPITDIRLYERDTPRAGVMEWIDGLARSGCILTVGLTRPFRGGSRPYEEHWLQINNIHPKEDPLWRSCPATPMPQAEPALAKVRRVMREGLNPWR